MDETEYNAGTQQYSIRIFEETQLASRNGMNSTSYLTINLIFAGLDT